jgi:hypothetical protein
MAQQPNVEITEAESPRQGLEPGPAVKWRSGKPGVPQGPADVARGGYFGATGPDAGWGLKILNHVTLPDSDPRLSKVVTGLTLARAAAMGRAPVPVDIEVALVLCGYGWEAAEHILERRQRWLEAVAHDLRPGATAVAEAERHLLVRKPEEIVYALRHTDRA